MARQQGYTVRLTVYGRRSHLRRTVYISGVLSGYFSPLTNRLGYPPRSVRPFARSATLRRASTPLAFLPPGGAAVPQFWIGAGAADSQDLAASRAFQQLLLPRQPQARLVPAPGGGHTMSTWRALLAPMLEWITPRLTSAAQQSPAAPAAAPSLALPLGSAFSRHSSR